MSDEFSDIDNGVCGVCGVCGVRGVDEFGGVWHVSVLFLGLRGVLGLGVLLGFVLVIFWVFLVWAM